MMPKYQKFRYTPNLEGEEGESFHGTPIGERSKLEYWVGHVPSVGGAHAKYSGAVKSFRQFVKVLYE